MGPEQPKQSSDDKQPPSPAERRGALRALQSALDEDTSLNVAEITKAAKACGVDVSNCVTRSDFERTISQYLTALPDEPSEKFGSAVEMPDLKGIRHGISTRYPRDYASYFESLSALERDNIGRAILARYLETRAEDNAPNAETSAAAFSGQYVGWTEHSPLMRSSRARNFLFEANPEGPHYVVELTWEKKNKASNAKTDEGRSANCHADLIVTDLATNDVLLHISISPMYPKAFDTDARSCMFRRNGQEYEFFAAAIAKRIDTIGKLPPLDESADSLDWQLRNTLSDLPGGEIFRDIWKAMPFEEDLRKFVAHDLQYLLDTPGDQGNQRWLRMSGSASAWSNPFRGKSKH